ncbi:metal ABC transporter permease, partial [Azospirillum sp.]|uniref:metal ABC transporter permease n=1 Tax=Azospirillum sp. TaxID=34012 RepID=UPI002D57F709
MSAEALRILTLQAGFNTAVVVAGTAALGLAAGMVGTFLLLRRRALISDALSHATLPGIAAAFLLGVALGVPGRSLPLLLAGAAVSGVLGVLTIQALVRFTRLTEDSAIGAVLATAFGLGVVLLSHIQA